MFDATAIVAIGGGVTLLTELIKFSNLVPQRLGLLVCAILAALGVLAYGLEQNYAMDVHHLWSIGSAWLTVTATAAGLYGFIREVRGSDVVSAEKR